MSFDFDTSEAFAKKMDVADPLAKYREHFYIPKETIYVDGNSLGLLSKASEEGIERVVSEWKTLAIKGWLEAEKPWFYFSENLGEMIAPLIGAESKEVVATGTTTVNLHALVSSFYTPKGKKVKILADELNFPTDIYALKSLLKLKGKDPRHDLVLAKSQDGYVLDEKSIVDLMTDDIALILLPSVLYRSGQLLDMPYLTKEANKRGIPIGFDCSHSVGVVPHHFKKWGVDFAFWCSYKYLNSGPGSSAYLYVNKKHFSVEPALAGWFGNNKETQFNMSLDFEPAGTAGQWQISSPGIIAAGAMEGALEVILDAGIDAIREKSVKMTSYFIYLIDEILSDSPYNYSIGTPHNSQQRGGHIAVIHKEFAFGIAGALRSLGVVPDYRPRNVIRIAPSPLYNRYHELWQIVQLLKQIIDTKQYKEFMEDTKAIS
jgi:kynureninase